MSCSVPSSSVSFSSCPIFVRFFLVFIDSNVCPGFVSLFLLFVDIAPCEFFTDDTFVLTLELNNPPLKILFLESITL